MLRGRYGVFNIRHVNRTVVSDQLANCCRMTDGQGVNKITNSLIPDMQGKLPLTEVKNVICNFAQWYLCTSHRDFFYFPFISS